MTIRFSAISTGEAQYRRAPPSRILRDRQRAQNRLNNISIVETSNSSPEHVKETHTRVYSLNDQTEIVHAQCDMEKQGSTVIVTPPLALIANAEPNAEPKPHQSSTYEYISDTGT